MTKLTDNLFTVNQPSPRISIREIITLLAAVLLVASCSSLPPNTDRETSYALTETDDTNLGKQTRSMLDQHPGLSGFHVLNDGMGAFSARARLITAAENSIDTQYYIWHDDLTGRVLHKLLLNAANQGVRVRLLLDDLDTADKEHFLQIIDAHPNIEIRLFNPFANRGMRAGDFITDTGRINRRMHIKTLTVDNQATIFGGRNIGNEYFDAGTDVAFGDVDALAIGPIVNEVSNQFDLYWNSQWVYPLAAFYVEQVDSGAISAFSRQSEEYMAQARISEYAEALKETDMAHVASLEGLEFTWSDWLLAFDQPSKVEATEVTAGTHLGPVIKEGMDNTERELIIVSPYFVPGPDFTQYLTELVERGVHVRILTNSLAANDVALVHAGYMRYREELVAGGVELYEYKASAQKKKAGKKNKKRVRASRASLHAKFFSFDQRFIFIGSFNLDARSLDLNAELGAYFESTEQGQRLSKNFDQSIFDYAYQVLLDDENNLAWITHENGEELRYTKEPDTSFWTRFTTRTLSIFVPESQL